MTMLTIEQLSYLLKFAIQKMKQPGVRELFPLLSVSIMATVALFCSFYALHVPWWPCFSGTLTYPWGLPVYPDIRYCPGRV